MLRHIAIEPEWASPALTHDFAEAVIAKYIAASGVKLISRESNAAFYQPAKPV